MTTANSTNSLRTRRDRLAKLLVRSRDDPGLFNDSILGRPPLHHLQREWCEAIVEYRSVAIETGNALGKDWLVGCLVPWWLYTRPNSLVIVTGPSQTLLGSVTWGEIRRAVTNSPIFKAGLLPYRISNGVKTSPQYLEVKPDWHALGFSTTSVERLSGQHRAQLLVIVEESSGVEDHVWEAIDGLKATKVVAIGNPLAALGGFPDLCDRGEKDAAAGVPRHLAVKHINTPSTASPHAHLEHSPYGLADKTWLEEQARKHGVDSLWYRGHVLAIRPKLENEVLFQPDWLSRSVSDQAARAAIEWRGHRDASGKSGAGRRVLACDVGSGSGAASTVMMVRDDVGILEIIAGSQFGLNQAADMYIRLAQKWDIEDRSRCTFDGAGDIGKRFALALDGKKFYGAIGYFGAGAGSKRYGNLRTSSAAAAARRLNPESWIGGKRNDKLFHIPDGEHRSRLIEELEQVRGREVGDQYHLEDKDDMKLRLGRSPDYADCFTQSFRLEAIEA